MATSLSGEEGGAPARLLRWWLRELRALAPATAPAWTREPLSVRIETGPDGDVAVLSRRGRRAEKELRRVALHPDALEESGSALAAAPTSGPVLRLSSDQVLSRRVRPPRAAEARLAEVLRHDMASQLPFGPEEAYFDHRVLGRSGATLDVEIFCVSRARLDRWRAALASAGLAPRAVTVDEESSKRRAPPIDLLRELKDRRWVDGGPRRMLLGGLVVVLAGVALWLPYEARRAQNALLEAEATTLRSAARQAIALEESIAAIEARQAQLQALLQGPPTRLSLLAEVTRALPDSAYARRVEIEGARLRIDGEAQEAAPLIAAIEASPAFQNAAFLSPVIRSAEGAERFQIGADIISSPEESP